MEFVAFKRGKMGTGASRRLRTSGRAPGIVYGGINAPALIEIDHNTLWHALKKEVFHASVLDMVLDGQKSRVLLRDVQLHPWKQQILHIDFQRVDDKTRLQMEVPLHFVNEENSAAVKIDKCVVNHVLNTIKVLCLPKDLPEFIEVDLASLEKGHSLHVSDLNLPKGVAAVIHGKNNAVVVNAVAAPVEEDVPAPVSQSTAGADDKAAPKAKK